MAKKKPPHNASHRLERYRPWLDRLLFIGALLGMLLVVHLGIQQQRHFAEGCFGFAETGGAFNCAAVTQSAASDLLGVSNVVWGFLFYLAVAALTFFAAYTKKDGRRHRLKQGRAALLAVGFVYSVYLTLHQFVSLDALCALCLTSAGLVTVLFAVQMVEWFTSSKKSTPSMSFSGTKREGVLLTSLVVLFIVLAGADWAYFRNQEGRAAPPVATASAADSLALPPGCQFDPELAPVENWPSIVRLSDPTFGPSDAPVTIIEFLDPNCPHCAVFYPVMHDVLAAYGDTVRMVYKPMPLWGFSVQQVEALYVAAQEGKFKAMLEAQFARQQQGGLSLQQLRGIASDIGMNADALAAQLSKGIFPHAMQQRKIAQQIGLSSVPTVLINGRFVHYSSRTPECLSAMIEAFAADR